MGFQGRGARDSPLPTLPGRHTRVLTSLREHKALGHVMGFYCPNAGPWAMGFWGCKGGMRGVLGLRPGRAIIHCYCGLSSDHRLSSALWERTVLRPA